MPQPPNLSDSCIWRPLRIAGCLFLQTGIVVVLYIAAKNRVRIQHFKQGGRMYVTDIDRYRRYEA